MFFRRLCQFARIKIGLVLSGVLLPSASFAACVLAPGAHPDSLCRNGDADTWLVKQRNAMGEGVYEFGQWLDEFFAGEEFEDADNASYLRVELEHTLNEDEPKYDTKFKLRIDLPNTEKKLKLILESEDKKRDELDGRLHQKDIDDDSQEGDGASSTVQYQFGDQWKQTTSLGLRTGSAGIEHKISYRFGRHWNLSELWSTRFQQTFTYVGDQGYSASTKQYFERRVGEHDLFRAKTVFFWEEEEEHQLGAAEVFSYFHSLDHTHGLEYRLAVVGEKEPTWRSKEHSLGLRYRRLLYRDWLFLEMVPEVAYSREENFAAELAFTTSVEILFTGSSDETSDANEVVWR